MEISIDYLSTSIITHKLKMVKKFRKAYVRSNGVKVRSKTYFKYTEVRIANPLLHCEIKLSVNELLIVGGVYVDDRGERYLCTSVYNFDVKNTKSILANVCTNPNSNRWSKPTNLSLIAKAAFEN